MAGSFRKLEMGVHVGAAVLVVLMLTVIVHAGVRPVIKQDSACNTTDVYVYPLGSACDRPVFFYVQNQLLARFHLERLSQGLPQAQAQGGLEPEWDESNDTYYVRLSGNPLDLGAQYAVGPVAASNSSVELPLRVNSSVYIFNVESQRALKWRQEGSDEYFLIEEEASSASPAATFRFVQDTAQLPLFCPIPVVCHAYYLVSNPGCSYTSDAGLMASVEDGITYVKAAPASSLGDLPLLLIRPPLSTTSTATT